jgi:hypothetical protein
MRQRPLTVPETAEQLGVTPERVRALITSGALEAERAHGVWLVDADAVARREVLNRLGVSAASVRPWSPLVAWAAMRWLDGDTALLDDLDRKSRHRLRARLDVAGPARLLSVVRNRAASVRVSVHPSRVDRLRAVVVPSGSTGAGRHGHGLSGDTAVDGYLTTEALVRARAELGVRAAPTGTHLLRVVTDARHLAGLDVAPRLAVAADLVDHVVQDATIDGRVLAVIRALLDDRPRTQHRQRRAA